MGSDEQRRVELLRRAFQSFPAFCGLLDIIPKGGGRQKLTLNHIQRQFCQERTGRDVVLKPRQIGFTTEEQARDIWHFLTFPGARVVTTCQSLQDNTPAKLLSDNYRVMFEGLERAGLQLKFRNKSATEWTLADRDASLRIVPAGASEASASKKGRAGTITRLHLTETAFYEYADTTLNALLECVPGRELGSEIVSESTANGASGYFFRQCQKAAAGESAYKLHFYPWWLQAEYRTELEPGETITPDTEEEELAAKAGATHEQLKWYRQKVADKGQDKTNQEYPCDQETCFLVSGRTFFDMGALTKLVRTATRDPIEIRKSKRLRIFAEPEKDVKYLMSLDCSEGIGQDPSGGLMYRRDTGEHVATLDGQFAPEDAARECVTLCKEYNDAELVIERNNHGHSAINTVVNELKYKKLWRERKTRRHGWSTDAVTRPVMLDDLEAALRKGQWSTPDRKLLAQMRLFIITDRGKPEAASGTDEDGNKIKDDMVISAAIGWAVRSLPAPARGVVDY